MKVVVFNRGDFVPHPHPFWILATLWVPLTSRRCRPKALLNYLQCRNQTPTTRMLWSKVPISEITEM